MALPYAYNRKRVKNITQVQYVVVYITGWRVYNYLGAQVSLG